MKQQSINISREMIAKKRDIARKKTIVNDTFLVQVYIHEYAIDT